MQETIQYGIQEKMNYVLLGAFAKLRKPTVSFVMSVSPFVCMEQVGCHGFGGIFMKFDFEYFSKICRENSSCIKI